MEVVSSMTITPPDPAMVPAAERELKTIAALQRSQKRGLFSADVSAGPAVDDHIQIKAGSLNVLPKPVLAVGFIDGALQALRRPEIFAPNVDVRLMTADGVSGDDHTLEQSMRVPLQDVAILKRSW